MAGATFQTMASDFPTQLVTWNPADKGADMILSGGNLSITGSAAVNMFARATLARSSGKWFFEFTLTNPGSNTSACGLGFANAAANDAALLSSTDAGCLLFFEGTTAGALNVSASFTIANAISQTWAASDVVQVAIDLTAGKIWYGKNGTWLTGSPSAGTSPAITFTPGLVLFPAFGGNSTTVGTGTANFGASAFNSLPPAGFRQWNAL